MNARSKNMEASAQRRRITRHVSPARRMAFEILRRVEEEGAFASVLLASVTDEMRAEDRALCYELILGALRWQLWLDSLIEHYAGRSADSLDAPVRRAMRLGLYQLRFLSRIPASAAVNESVNLAYEARLRSAASLINAVLRRATREPKYDPAAHLSDPIERMAVETSHPTWLIERWCAAFGPDETAAFARANNRTPPVAFRINPLRAENMEAIDRLGRGGVRLEASRIAPSAWRVEGAGGALIRALTREGMIYTQDEASQLVALALDPQPGERVLDVCAAPGSKTSHIAAMTGNQALVVAGDLYAHRLRVVSETAARQLLKSIRLVVLDAEEPLPFGDGSFDRVLVDAPCTGTGTLRHNPEIRWRISASDIVDLAARQERILTGAARMLRRGGRLVYSTCSVEPEENEMVVAAFLATFSEFKQVSAKVSAPLLTASGAARTWPHRNDTDGFFIAVFERD